MDMEFEPSKQAPEYSRVSGMPEVEVTHSSQEIFVPERNKARG